MSEQPIPTDKKAPFLYIVIPCYNEKTGHVATIEETNLIFGRVLKQLEFKQSTYDFETKKRSARVGLLSPTKLLNVGLDTVTPFSMALLSLIATLGNLVCATGIGVTGRISGETAHRSGKRPAYCFSSSLQ